MDVIIVHRLLKNSVKADHYLLLTEAAIRELNFPGAMTFKSNVELYEVIGSIKTAVYDFDFSAQNNRPKGKPSFGIRYCESLRLYVKLWFRPLTSSGPNFRNLSDGSSRVAKVAFALLIVILTPIFVPIGALLLAFHSLFN